MRRFIVEVLLDAVLLFFIVLLLGIISVGQPFPFGPTSVPAPMIVTVLTASSSWDICCRFNNSTSNTCSVKYLIESLS